MVMHFKKRTVRLCLSCSAEFQPIRSWQKFCSVDCRNSFWLASSSDICQNIEIGPEHMLNLQSLKAGLEKAANSFKPEYKLTCKAFLVSIRVVLPQERTFGLADIDHFINAVFNTFKGTVWADDNRIFQVHAQKRYVEEDEKPCMKIQVIPLPNHKKRPR